MLEHVSNIRLLLIVRTTRECICIIFVNHNIKTTSMHIWCSGNYRLECLLTKSLKLFHKRKDFWKTTSMHIWCSGMSLASGELNLWGSFTKGKTFKRPHPCISGAQSLECLLPRTKSLRLFHKRTRLKTFYFERLGPHPCICIYAFMRLCVYASRTVGLFFVTGLSCGLSPREGTLSRTRYLSCHSDHIWSPVRCCSGMSLD